MKEKNKNNPKQSVSPSPLEESTSMDPLHPYAYTLHFDVYRQHFNSWWFDSDSDKHDGGTIYANLRFYKDGTVLGIRAATIPKREVPHSFTLKGHWARDKNNIAISLKRTSAIDDTVAIAITSEEERNMKYAGAIANDSSLIKAGNWNGVIRTNAIVIGDHSFTKLTSKTLIITASEALCQQLDTQVREHPFVVETFRDSGNWYTNGETGAPWFTVHIVTAADRKKDIEAFVAQRLKESDTTAHLFWS